MGEDFKENKFFFFLNKLFNNMNVIMKRKQTGPETAEASLVCSIQDNTTAQQLFMHNI